METIFSKDELACLPSRNADKLVDEIVVQLTKINKPIALYSTTRCKLISLQLNYELNYVNIWQLSISNSITEQNTLLDSSSIASIDLIKNNRNKLKRYILREMKKCNIYRKEL